MNKPSLKVKARASKWGTPDGEQIDIVRLLPTGGKAVGIDYTEIPNLIADLARLLHDHLKEQGADHE